MNKLVSFELAKLLKEKGYGNVAPHKLNRNYYNHKGELNGNVTDYIKAFVSKKELTDLETVDAPTITEVVMWLYEKQGVWISVHYHKSKRFSVTICDECDNSLSDGLFGDLYNSPTEAYEAAIEYILNNLL
jgi:hypothetical protein